MAATTEDTATIAASTSPASAPTISRSDRMKGVTVPPILTIHNHQRIATHSLTAAEQIDARPDRAGTRSLPDDALVALRSGMVCRGSAAPALMSRARRCDERFRSAMEPHIAALDTERSHMSTRFTAVRPPPAPERSATWSGSRRRPGPGLSGRFSMM
jgi:hypothetical protein